jgi:hypothetical protein
MSHLCPIFQFSSSLSAGFPNCPGPSRLPVRLSRPSVRATNKTHIYALAEPLIPLVCHLSAALMTPKPIVVAQYHPAYQV